MLEALCRSHPSSSMIPACSLTRSQWNSDEHAGFTTGTPWMRVNDDYKCINVSLQQDNRDSVLSFYKLALQTRKEHDVLVSSHLNCS